jgi:hypothetical protein
VITLRGRTLEDVMEEDRGHVMNWLDNNLVESVKPGLFLHAA